jgi:hypothetical protein
MFTPNINNQLEATNKMIKDEYIFRERHSLSRFFTVTDDIVKIWSIRHNPDQTDPTMFSTESTIILKKWTNAYHSAQSSRVVLQLPFKTKGFTHNYIPAGEVVNITKNEIQRYKRKKWTSFDQFKDVQFGITKITLSNVESEWKNGICNCPKFLKEYIRKYLFGVAIRLRFCKSSLAARDVRLCEKRERG